MAQMWGHVVMAEANHFVASCKLAAANSAAISACDLVDGVRDGVIADPTRCKFVPGILTRFQPADCQALTDADVAVIRRIWEGPTRRDGSFLWYGLPRGADLVALNKQPLGITLDWWRYFLKQDARWTWGGVTHASFEQLWDQSVEQFSTVLATDNPDLSAFRDAGGKAILWHGWADQLIYAQGTIDYYNRVRERMGARTPEFLRLFMAPGVAHCGGGPGPAPVGQFESLVKWVEDGVAPETLATRTHPLCLYPLVARYKGSGDITDAANFVCSSGFGSVR
jgi:hypothetical protein